MIAQNDNIIRSFYLFLYGMLVSHIILFDLLFSMGPKTTSSPAQQEIQPIFLKSSFTVSDALFLIKSCQAHRHVFWWQCKKQRLWFFRGEVCKGQLYLAFQFCLVMKKGNSLFDFPGEEDSARAAQLYHKVSNTESRNPHTKAGKILQKSPYQNTNKRAIVCLMGLQKMPSYICRLNRLRLACESFCVG